eukprot:scaffold33331_cov42-Attheya_sp.AAC.1
MPVGIRGYEIHKYLLLKGVEAMTSHEENDQVESNEAVAMYNEKQKNTLVTTDIKIKDLYFADIF